MTELFVMLQAAGGSQNNMMNLVMILLIFVVFYFFMIRPQMKKQKDIRKFREGIKVNDKVVTAGGIHGKIREIKDTTFIVEISEGVKITLDKGSVFNSAQDMQQK